MPDEGEEDVACRVVCRLLCRSGLAAVAALAGAGGSLAEEGDKADGPVMLDRVVVTSTGDEKAEQRHPGNIATIPTEDVDFVQPNLASNLLNQLPGVNIQSGSGMESLTAIRSPVLTGGEGAGSFLYLEDGVSMRAAGFQNVNAFIDPIYEISGGIEVIRGPAGALYGSNALHGLVNFLSLEPTEEPENQVTASIGSHELVDAYGTLSTTFEDEAGARHGARATAVIKHDGGYRADSGFDQQKGRLRYDYDDGRTSTYTTLTAVNLNQETAGFVTGHDAYRSTKIAKSNPNPEAYRDAWAVRFASHIEHDLNDDWMLSFTPYSRVNRMQFLMHFLPGQPTETNHHWSVGMQSRGYWYLPGGSEAIFGLDTEYTEAYLRQYQAGPTVFSYVQGLQYDYDVDALVLAPYFHSTWSLTPQTELTAGVRLEYTNYAYTNNAPNGTFGRFLRIPSQTDVFFDVTPKLGLAHVFSDEATLFASAARGAAAPQTTELYRLQTNQTPGEVTSTTIDSVELGARGNIEGVTYEIAAYYMYKRNVAFRDADGFTVSDGKTVHMGIEGQFYAPLPFGFYLDGSATYARHAYAFDNIVTTPANPTESIRKGDLVDTAPKTLADMRFGYGFLDDTAAIELEWVHVGPYWMDASNTVEYGGHDIFNLRAAWAVTDAFELFGSVHNLFNTPYADRADFAFGNERYFPGELRGFRGGIQVTF